MTIKTRYDLRDKVKFVLPDDGKTYTGTITRVEAEVRGPRPRDTKVTYWVYFRWSKDNMASITDKDIIGAVG